MQGGHSLTPSLPTITQPSRMRDGRMHLPLRINSYRKGPRRLCPTTGKFMNEAVAVNDTSSYFRLLVTVKPLSLQYLCKTGTFRN